MNNIDVKNIKTCYDYSENYWVIDGKAITYYLDEWIRTYNVEILKNMGSMLGLLPAWGGKLEWQWENDFIWELIDSMEELNVPLLVCEDDCDLSCIVIMVHIRKTIDKVLWERIGSLDHSKENRIQMQKSGILCLEAYTEEDWEKYGDGDNIATEKYDSREYWEWVSNNCYEEHIRRLRNYMKPYMQQEENIEWFENVNWEFDVKEYECMVEKFRKLKNCCEK